MHEMIKGDWCHSDPIDEMRLDFQVKLSPSLAETVKQVSNHIESFFKSFCSENWLKNIQNSTT